MMRLTRALPLSVLFFIVSVIPASASITTLPNATTTPQPFSFYCDPYTFGFITNHHYTPQNNATCVYASPLPAGSTQFTLYKGTIGNATIVEQDFYTGTFNVINTSPNNIGTPNAGDTFFAVVYDASLGSDMNDYFTGATTTPPQAAHQNVNYFVMPFTYGPKTTSDFNPVVIVPDIYGSWQKDSGPVIDPIFNNYQNLIDTLIANGYVLGQTLFTFPYNWEQSNTTSALQLKTKIQSIKATCSCDHVDVVAHGMGGIVAQQYVQSPGYSHDIDQLILLGTPFKGVPALYQAWEAGKILNGNTLQSGLEQTFINQEAKDLGYADAFSYIQAKPVASFKELLPIMDYLFGAGNTPLSYPTGYPRNTFLENLIFNFSGWQGVRVTNIAADNGQTNTIGQYVVGPSSQPPKWQDGEPQTTSPLQGDGFATLQSISNFEFIDHLITTSHNNLPTDAESYVYQALTGSSPATLVTNSYPVGSVLFINLAGASSDMVIIDPSGNRLGKDFLTNTVVNQIPGAFYSGFNVPSEYAIIVNPSLGQYQVQVQGHGSGGFTLAAKELGGFGAGSGGTSGTSNTGSLAAFQMNVVPFTGFIGFTPLDTTPPTITVTTPQNGATYFRNDTVMPSVTITDPDGSTIASTSYQFNGSTVDPSQPLPFNLALSGTSTAMFVVFASDIFGNATTSTTTFTVAPPDLNPPAIKITSPLKYGIYAKTDTTYLTANSTDQSPIIKTTYWFAGKQINPALPLPLSTVSTPSVQQVMVSATDKFGNTATSSLKFFVVKDKNSCLVDIIAVLILLSQDKSVDKPTLQQLKADCSALLKGYHRHDDNGHDY